MSSGFGSDDDETGLYSDLNWLNERLYTKRYRQLLAERERLPITKWKKEFLRLLDKNRVVLVNTESGAGKTTQIPQYCLRYVWQKFPGKKVVCSQPSKLATQHAAQRVAKELDVKLGEEVAYYVRYDETEGHKRGLLLYCTDGHLRNVVSRSQVQDYAVIIVDDVHERTINIDVLIGLLKPILEKPDSKIRLVLMGTRLNKVADFKSYFGGIATTTIDVPGRQHHVQIEYFMEDEVPDTKEHPYLKQDHVRNFLVERCVAKVIQIHRSNSEVRGDILLILPGKEDLFDAREQLREQLELSHKQDNACECVECVGIMEDPILVYADLTDEELKLVFKKSSNNLPYVRRCFVSTGLADSYLDLKDIVFVVDSGVTKQPHYSERMKESNIAVQSITKAIAQKRAGLAGRSQDGGVCYRMYTEASYKHLKEVDPEIRHGNMCNNVLRFIETGIPIATFQFIEKPVQALIEKAIKTLKSIGAIDADLRLLDLGWRIKRLHLPLDPPLAAMLIKSAIKNMRIYEELIMLATMLNSAPPWKFVTDEERNDAYSAWSDFDEPYGDHFTLLEIFRCYSRIAELDKKEWCTNNFLLYNVLNQANHLHKELIDLLQRGGYTFIKVVNSDCLRPIVKIALLHGFPLKVAYYKIHGHGFCHRAERGFYVPADAELSQEQLASLDKWGGYQVHGASVYARGRGCGMGSGWVLYHRTNDRKLLTVTGLTNTAMLIENPEIYDALATYSNEEFKRRLAALKEEEEQRAAAAEEEDDD